MNLHKHQLYLLEKHNESFKSWSAINNIQNKNVSLFSTPHNFKNGFTNILSMYKTKKCEIISEAKHLCNLFIYTIKVLFCVLNKYKCTHDLTNMSYTRKRWYNQNRSVELHQRLPMFPWARHLTSLLSTGWFKERIWAWFHNRAKIN